MTEKRQVEPWLRGTMQDVDAVQRAVLHALVLAEEDLARWCRNLSDVEINSRPAGIEPVAFHIRHIARSLDRLLSYAEGHALSEAQLAALKSEMAPGATRDALWAEFEQALISSTARIRAFPASALEAPRTVGKSQLPSTLGGLLVHVADHTQRHVGQAITTAKTVVAQRSRSA